MKKFFNIRPIMVVSLNLVLGILFAYLDIQYDLSYLILLFPLINLIFPIIYAKDKIKFHAAIIMLFASILTFNGSFFLLKAKFNEFYTSKVDEKYYIISGDIESVKENVLMLNNCVLENKNVKLKYKIKVSSDILLNVGDKITFTGDLHNLNSKNLINNILNRERYSTTLKRINLENVTTTKNIFLKAKTKIFHALDSGMDSKEAAFAKAMMTGDTNYLSYDDLTPFRYGGIAHIFAVSGLHVGLVYSSMYFLTKNLNINKIVKLIFQIFIIFFYVGICSFSPSSLRAFIMCSVLILINFFGVKYDFLNSFLISSVVLLLISPFFLFDIGFQLSMMVTFALTLLTNPIARSLKFLPKKLSKTLAVILAAQFGSTPILLFYFKYISILSVIVNLIFVPILSSVYLISFFCVILSMIVPLYNIILFIPYKLLNFFTSVISFINFEKYIISGINLSYMIIVYYLLLLSISDKINFTKKARVTISLILSCIFITGTVAINIPKKNIAEVYAYNGANNFYIVKNNRDTVLITFNKVSPYLVSQGLSKIKGNKIDYCIVLNRDNRYKVIKTLNATLQIQKYYVVDNGDNIANLFYEGKVESFSYYFNVGDIEYYFLYQNSLRFKALGLDSVILSVEDKNFEEEIKTDVVYFNDKHFLKLKDTMTKRYFNCDIDNYLQLYVKNGKIKISI